MKSTIKCEKSQQQSNNSVFSSLYTLAEIMNRQGLSGKTAEIARIRMKTVYVEKRKKDKKKISTETLFRKLDREEKKKIIIEYYIKTNL